MNNLREKLIVSINSEFDSIMRLNIFHSRLNTVQSRIGYRVIFIGALFLSLLLESALLAQTEQNPASNDANSPKIEKRAIEKSDSVKNNNLSHAKDPIKTLHVIRKEHLSRHNNGGTLKDLLNSPLYNSALIRKNKASDTLEGIANYWYLSSLELDHSALFFGIDIIKAMPDQVTLETVDPVQEMCESVDIEQVLVNMDFGLPSYCHANYPLPQNVIDFLKELNFQTIYTLSGRVDDDYSSPFVDSLALCFGFVVIVIVAYLIYRFFIWLFVVDPEVAYDMEDPSSNNFIVPAGSEAYHVYFSETKFIQDNTDNSK